MLAELLIRPTARSGLPCCTGTLRGLGSRHGKAQPGFGIRVSLPLHFVKMSEAFADTTRKICVRRSSAGQTSGSGGMDSTSGWTETGLYVRFTTNMSPIRLCCLLYFEYDRRNASRGWELILRRAESIKRSGVSIASIRRSDSFKRVPLKGLGRNLA